MSLPGFKTQTMENSGANFPAMSMYKGARRSLYLSLNRLAAEMLDPVRDKWAKLSWNPGTKQVAIRFIPDPAAEFGPASKVGYEENYVKIPCTRFAREFKLEGFGQVKSSFHEESNDDGGYDRYIISEIRS